MTQLELIKMFDEYDKKGKWIFELGFFYMCFTDENEQVIKNSLSRHEKSGLIERICKGIYANPRALSKARVFDTLAYVSNRIRDKAMSYLSLESVLSEENVISQIPFRYTFISKGTSATFHTPYGTIEYIHTSKNAKDLHKYCYYDEQRQIWVASKDQAISDAYAHNRAVDLIEEQKMKYGEAL